LDRLTTFKIGGDRSQSETHGYFRPSLGRIYFGMQDFGSAELHYEAAAALGIIDAEVMVKLARDADDESFGQQLDYL
jgi:hypothetical protein